jgi:hypothetical protein
MSTTSVKFFNVEVVHDMWWPLSRLCVTALRVIPLTTLFAGITSLVVVITLTDGTSARLLEVTRTGPGAM